MQNNFYTLEKLPYNYSDLEPFISKEQLTIHYEKHHSSYVNNANEILKKGQFGDSKKLSFNIGGHKLHSLFWKNMISPQKQKIPDEIIKILENEFSSFEKFKEEFLNLALLTEGSSWVALVFDKDIKKLLLMQIEKHNLNIYPEFNILLVLDLWEHAYYIDYKNEKKKFVEAFFNVINFEEVLKRYKKLA
ncbi:MAG: superoxide dismutase [Candidatus Paceibacterota bacterium]